MQHTPEVTAAGRSGPEVRSDVRVTFEPRDSGGLDIELMSRVAPYYGDAIRRQSSRVLDDLHIRNARLRIEDEGALPFVLAARIEAAVRRTGLGTSRRAIVERAALQPSSPRDRLRRSRLYVPGSEPKYFINASLYEPDAIIFDLEDSVHPGEKDSARILVRNALRAIDFSPCERMVRINPLPLGLSDLDEVIPECPDLVLIPKTETAAQVIEIAHHVSRIEANARTERRVWFMPILETPLGIENAFAIASSSDRVVALTIGLEDYATSIGVEKTREGDECLFARMRLVNAAKAAHVQVNDSVYAEFGDLDGLRRWAERSRALGFEGMGCVHPLQIAVVNEAFAPSPAEIERALKIVAAYDAAKQRGLGVVSLGSKMVDAPIVQRALKLVEHARAMGLVR